MRAPTVVATPTCAPPVTTAPAASDPFDAEWSRAMVGEVLAPMTDRYFRARIVGAERIPAQGPLVLAANHSGNAFPYDGMVLDALLWRLYGMRDADKMRTVYEHELSLAWWLRPFGIDDFWRRGGGVDMTFDNFDRLLARGDRVLYFPEGVPGIGKGFARRYQLQPFHTSFLLLAARHAAPVLPLYVVNGEWLHPFGYTFRTLDRLAQRVFRVPFLPLPLGLLAMVLPWVWFLVFPARLVFVVGEPLDVAGALRAEGVTDLDAPDRDGLRRATARIGARMQRELDAAVVAHQVPRYGVRELARALRGDLTRLLPTGWPAAFIRLERDRARPPARGRLHALLRDWDLLGWWLPFGWVLLALARALRRPPYGRRGLARGDARERAGEFVWRLAERPLPPRAVR
ncbi:MAG: 1-acyl-sn-glycerol-3-phosphate acyltransferase [Gemmatirosa sp.]